MRRSSRELLNIDAAGSGGICLALGRSQHFVAQRHQGLEEASMSQAVAVPVPATQVRPYLAAPSVEPEALSRLMAQPIRFAILRALCTHEALSFSDLKR